MADESNLRLETVSVVVTAEYHNPSILNADFLKSHNIVPTDWTVAETLTTPALSVVKYANGVEWNVDQSRLIVAETKGLAFGHASECHQLMTKYLGVLPHVPYRALGLNCRVSVFQDAPRRWLVDRFGANWLRNDAQVRGTKLTVALEAEAAICNVTLDGAKRNEQPCVVADCNLHHESLLDVRALQDAIAQWPARSQFIVAALDRLLLDSGK